MSLNLCLSLIWVRRWSKNHIKLCNKTAVTSKMLSVSSLTDVNQRGSIKVSGASLTYATCEFGPVSQYSF